jgi:hypothetical protein
MIYTAPCVMLLMRAYTLRGQVGGVWALEIEFFGPYEMASSLIGECHVGPQSPFTGQFF